MGKIIFILSKMENGYKPRKWLYAEAGLYTHSQSSEEKVCSSWNRGWKRTRVCFVSMHSEQDEDPAWDSCDVWAQTGSK